MGNFTPHMDKPGYRQHPLLVSSFGNGRASIYAGSGFGIEIKEMEWLVIKKLVLIGSGRKKGNVRNGLSILHCYNVSVDSMDISGFQKSGIQIDYSGDVVIRHVFSHENGFAGISVGGADVSKKLNHNIYIGNCRVENNPGDPSNLDNHSGNGIVVSGCTKVLIEYCTATNNGWDMPRKGNGPVGIWAFEADSVIIQHCLSYRNKTSVGGADGGGFDLDGGVTHSIVQYCLSYENQGAGYCLFQYLYASPWHDNIYRYNISENDGAISDAHSGVYVWNSSKMSDQFYNCWFYNNTIYNAKGTSVRYSELNERKGFAFYNNIFATRDVVEKGQASRDIFRGNVWWMTNPAIYHGTKNGFESGKEKLMVTDPDFKKAGKASLTSADAIKRFNHYKIPPGSLLRKNGINLKGSYGFDGGGFDFNGKKAPVAGIGACF
jgi:hypothetical protein